jgi:hypothetical protein
MSWDQELIEPIIVAGNEPLRTLRDCARHLSKLSRSERAMPEWQAVADVLARAGRGIDPMMVRVVMLAALLTPKPKVISGPEKSLSTRRSSARVLAFAR